MPETGAAQGLDVRDGRGYVYGDASRGVIVELELDEDGGITTVGGRRELTAGGTDLVPHPTGLTSHPSFGTFLGNTIAGEGEIFRIDWDGFLAAGNLEGALLHRIADGAAVNGSRPEFVRVQDRWLIGSADYGDEGNEIRLYDPALLSSAADTTEPGVVVGRFPAGRYVQSLFYWASRDVLVLVENRRRGRGWRLVFLALEASVERGQAQVLDVLEPDLPGELEGFHLFDESRAVLVTSAAAGNAYAATLRDAPGAASASPE